MAVILVARKDRDNDMTEVTLAQDENSLVMHVHRSVADSPDAQATYQKMMDDHLRSTAPIREAVERNKSV